ncbi:MAG: T9SS type A sorting domain-containing protein [Saprospiraceae bacterium]
MQIKFLHRYFLSFNTLLSLVFLLLLTSVIHAQELPKLIDKNLQGTLPKEIQGLTELKLFWASTNDLTGSIPDEIGNLTNLTDLRIPYNNFTGGIPATFSNLTGLQYLHLAENKLTGNIPSWLSGFPLLLLHLNDNQFTGCIPTELNSLCSINLQTNDNPALPWGGDKTKFCNGDNPIGASCDDGNPRTLNDVIQANCECMGVYDCRTADSLALVTLRNRTFGVLWNKTWDLNMPMDTWHGVTLDAEGCVIGLDLSCNNLQRSIPAEVGDLVDLQVLRLDGNQLEGCIPDELSIFCSLGNNFRLDGNVELSWQGDESTFCGGMEQISASCDDRNPHSTNDVILSNCKCQGMGGESCRMNDSLALVALYNSAGGVSWSNPWNLTMTMDNWQGVTLNSLGCVETLALNSRGLAGTIPAEIGDLSQLVTLRLNSNNLTGSLPHTINNLINLETLFLSFNQLSGNVPDISQLTYLSSLQLSGNQFTGELPADWVNLKNLKFLNLSSNQFVGCIPGSWSQFCPNQQNVTLGGNTGLEETNFLNFCSTAAGTCPLPLELISFEGQIQDLENHLTWQTAFEENIKAFRLQRSPNGKDDWVTIYTTPSQFSNAENRYRFIDKSPLPLTYYRLQIIEESEKFYFSNTLVLQKTIDIQWKIYPNPARQQLIISNLKNQEGQIQIVNIHGKDMFSANCSSLQPIDVSNWQSGV